MESDSAYYRRRASEENLAAALATGPEARRAHQDLAARFRDLSEGFCLQAAIAEEDEMSEPVMFLTLENAI